MCILEMVKRCGKNMLDETFAIRALMGGGDVILPAPGGGGGGEERERERERVNIGQHAHMRAALSRNPQQTNLQP